MLAAYDRRCAISECDIEPLLEAAHIHPYRGTETNHVSNGLLLRADLHTLFDLGLLAFDATDAVLVSDRLAHTEYAALSGCKLRPSKTKEQQASRPALAWHRVNVGKYRK